MLELASRRILVPGDNVARLLKTESYCESFWLAALLTLNLQPLLLVCILSGEYSECLSEREIRSSSNLHNLWKQGPYCFNSACLGR